MINIKENIPLSKYTTIKVGGPARFFCEPNSEEEIIEAVNFAKEKKLTVFVLGGGSNLLVSDKGFSGLVIKIRNTSYKMHNTDIECGAGVSLSKIVSESAKAGLSGLEWAVGIPGTVGGAIRGNAGAFGREISDNIENVRVLDISDMGESKITDSQISNKIPSSKSQKIFELASKDCKFSYRTSIFKQNPNLIVLSAMLKFKKGDEAEIEQKMKEILKQRRSAQPFDYPSSGSFFKNPVVKRKSLIEEYERETGKKALRNVVPAGFIIDILGLRGKKISGAMVSQHHGNFLVNAGSAKAEDFIILSAFIKTRARNTFGVQLQEEVQLVGF